VLHHGGEIEAAGDCRATSEWDDGNRDRIRDPLGDVDLQFSSRGA